MPLLVEYALTPGIFNEDTFAPATKDEVIYGSFALLREIFINEGLVRNLYGGAWKDLFSDGSQNWHPKGRELLRKLIEQNRMILAPKVLVSIPAVDKEWCEEALASHHQSALGGIVTTDDVAAQYPRTHPQIAAVSRLPSAQWWGKRDCSARVERTFGSYLKQISIILKNANFISFIDPHVDPSKPHYRDFPNLIKDAAKRTPLPLIQIHRGIRDGNIIVNPAEWKKKFTDALGLVVKETNVKIELFVWDEMHDRYLISDIIGICMPNGFDTTTRTDSLGKTTWNRMSRALRDEVLKDYDEAAHFRKFKGQNRFVIPAI